MQLKATASVTIMSSRSINNSTSSSSINRRRSSNSHDESFNEVVAKGLGLDEHTVVILKYILAAVGVLTALKTVAQTILYLTLAATPVIYFYLKATCPTIDTFDAKEELKPILGGYHLPAEEQDRRSSWEKMLSSAKASVTAEYSALVGDTQTEFTHFFGVVIVAKVTCQQQSYYWLGARQEWTFLYKNGGNGTGSAAPAATITSATPRRVSSSNRNNNSSSSVLTDNFTESMTRRASTAMAAAAEAAMASLSSSTASRPDDSKKRL